MQAEYKKEWMDTYLWVLPEKQNEDLYVEQMLLHHQGEGRLEFSKQTSEGEEYYCYKVTGKKSLNSIYAMLSIGERQIRNILSQLFQILESGREYLLSEEDFVLAPSYIFAEFPQLDLALCYVPGYGVPLKEQLEGLFEYLLNRVDYDDKNAVELLYDCYMFCMKESGGLSQIRERIETQKKEESIQEENWLVSENMESSSFPETYKTEKTKKTEKIQKIQKTGKKEKGEQISKTENNETSVSKMGKSHKEKAAATVRYPEAFAQEKHAATGSYFAWLSEKLFPRRGKGTKDQIPIVAQEREVYRAVPEQKIVYEEEKEEEEEERTVLLSSLQPKEELFLIHGKTGEMIRVNKFPFFIGTAQDYVDFVPKGDGVSRIHCCINKKGSNYYISDLNSTNGTYLDEREVLPGKEELLSANAQLCITTELFYIKFPCH